jgi:hypothetical protein
MGIENYSCPFAIVGHSVDNYGNWELIEFSNKEDFRLWVGRKLNPSHQPEKIGDKKNEDR